MTIILAHDNPTPQGRGGKRREGENAITILSITSYYEPLKFLRSNPPTWMGLPMISQLTMWAPLPSSTPSQRKSLMSFSEPLHTRHGALKREESKWEYHFSWFLSLTIEASRNSSFHDACQRIKESYLHGLLQRCEDKVACYHLVACLEDDTFPCKCKQSLLQKNTSSENFHHNWF